MKSRYPIEAFALAMVVFSQNMRNALITGILILLVTILGLVLDMLFGSKIPKWSRDSCNIILTTALTYSIFQIVLIALLGYEIKNTDAIFHVFLGMLIAKHIIDSDCDSDYNRLLSESAGAYAVLLIIAIIREFMAEGAVFGFEIADFALMSGGFSDVIAGLILSSIGIAILNFIFYKDKHIKTEGLLVIIPVVFLIQPFTIDSLSQPASMAITIIIALLMLYSIRKYLVFSRLGKEIRGLPADLMSMGIIYIIFSMF